MGDGLQGAAADCNSAGETHAWFDSKVAHHSINPLSVFQFALPSRRQFRSRRLSRPAESEINREFAKF